MRIAKDKLVHFSVCAMVAVIGMIFFRIMLFTLIEASVSALMLGIAIGVGKECGDHFSPTNKWDWWDILADTIGTISGVLVAMPMWLV